MHVIVATPLGENGQGGIDRIMDEVRREVASSRPADMDIAFVTTRGQRHLVWSVPLMMAALSRVTAARLRGRCDVLHVNLSSHGSAKRKMILCAAADRLKIPYVLHLHGSQFRQYSRDAAPAESARLAAMFERATRIIVLGEVWRAFVAQRVPSAQPRITIVPNASRARTLPPQPATSDDLTILFLGHVGPRKGVPELVDALAALRSVPGWRAVIAGNGEVEQTRSRISAAGLADRIRLTGWVGPGEVETLLATSDILVLPSFDENLPMSVIEGMAYGLAVVATPVGAVTDIIADGESGLLIPPGDAVRLAEAIRRLILDPDLRLRLGRNAAAFHRAHLEVGPYVSRLVDIWREAGGPRGQ